MGANAPLVVLSLVTAGVARHPLCCDARGCGCGRQPAHRVLRGHVIDFLRVVHAPVFNVADIAVCIGYEVPLPTMLFARAVPQG